MFSSVCIKLLEGNFRRNIFERNATHNRIENQRYLSGYVLIRSISLCDFGFQLSTIFFSLLEIASPINQHNELILCWSSLFLRSLSFLSIAYLIIAMGAERLYAVFQPINYREKIKISTNKKLTFFSVFLAMVVSLPLFSVSGVNSGSCDYDLTGLSPVLRLGIFFITTFMSAVLPVSTTLVMNVILIVKLRKRQEDNRNKRR